MMDEFLAASSGRDSAAGDESETLRRGTEALRRFCEANANSFTFCDRGYPLFVKEDFVKELMRRLRRGEGQWDDAEFQKYALTALRIVSRERKGIDALHSDDGMRLLMHCANTRAEQEGSTDGILHDDAAVEAVKCLINAVLNNPDRQRFFTAGGGCEGLLRRLCSGDRSAPYTDFGLRLLFMVTATSPDAAERLYAHGGAELLAGLVDGLVQYDAVPLSAEADAHAAEAYKVLFNITGRLSRFSDRPAKDPTPEELQTFRRIVESVRTLVLGIMDKCGDFGSAALAQAMTLLFNTPPGEEDALVHNKDDTRVLDGVVRYLDVVSSLKDTDKLQGQLVAILLTMRSFARTTPYIRRYLYRKILPRRKEFKRRPEQEQTVRGHLVRLMTSHLTPLNSIVVDFLFVLCKENVSRLTHHTGYGNAAGLFAQKGILGMPLDRSNAPDYSSDSGPSSDSDEGEADIDVVTGTYRPSGPHPLTQLPPDEQEREAEKLMRLVNKINESGVVKVMGLDERTGETRELKGPDA